MPSRWVAGRNGLVPEKEITYKGYKHLVYTSELNVSFNACIYYINLNFGYHAFSFTRSISRPPTIKNKAMTTMPARCVSKKPVAHPNNKGPKKLVARPLTA